MTTHVSFREMDEQTSLVEDKKEKVKGIFLATLLFVILRYIKLSFCGVLYLFW